MGYRTLVLLHNDRASEWEKDETLGRKIAIGMNDAMGLRGPGRFSAADLGYGTVVQCTHADTQTLAIVDSYSFTPIVHSFWRQGQTQQEIQKKLLELAAAELGYKLVKVK